MQKEFVSHNYKPSVLWFSTQMLATVVLLYWELKSARKKGSCILIDMTNLRVIIIVSCNWQNYHNKFMLLRFNCHFKMWQMHLKKCSCPERPCTRTLKWLNGNSISHSHSLDWSLFKVPQRTRKSSIVTFNKKFVSPRLSCFKFSYWWSKENCTYNWSIGIVSWGVCSSHSGSTLLWVPWWLATHGRYKTNAVNKCYHGDLQRMDATK